MRLIKKLNEDLNGGVNAQGSLESLKKLEAYWVHQQELLRGYEKNREKLAENMRIMDGWVADVRDLLRWLA